MTEEQTGVQTLRVEEKEQLLDRLTQELYQAHRGFAPKFPWVFVRVLKKEQERGGIILPDSEQNKPVHEAIVLAVWPSFIESKTKNGHRITVYKESELSPGDHVLLPHYAGLPVRGFKEQQYRIVKELGWDASVDGGIFATVGYSEPDHKPAEKLRKLLLNAMGTGFELEDLLAKIQEQFLLVDRDAHSVTLSGR